MSEPENSRRLGRAPHCSTCSHAPRHKQHLKQALLSASTAQSRATVLYALGLCHQDVQLFDDAAAYFTAAAKTLPSDQR